jgi:hypothetical protein
MSHESKELRVGPNETSRRIMYLAKEFLLNNDSIDVTAGTLGASIAARAVESLVRLKYVTYEDIKTETAVVQDRRRTRLFIRIKKTSQFNALYQENEANRKKKEEQTPKETPKK